MNHWMRQTHRWMSITFAALVGANFAAMGAGLGEQPTLVLGMVTLIPLFVLLSTGLYMFVLPYAARWRGGPSAV